MIRRNKLHPIALFCLCVNLTSFMLWAQDAGSNAGQLWKDAQSAFGKADYAGSTKALQAIIKTSAATSQWLNGTNLPPAPPNRQWLEPVFYMLGATYFNAKDWTNAISTFNAYRQLFPKSPRLTQITFSLAQAELLGGHPEDSIPLFTSLLPNSNYHVNALLLLVEADKRAGKLSNAILLLETESALPNLNRDFLGKIRIKLFAMYLDNGDKEKAVLLLQQIDADIAHVQDVTEFNALAVRLGDLLLAENKIAGALNCYRRVRDNDQILALQKQQVESLQRQRVANLASIQADPLNSDQLQLDNKAIDNQIVNDQKILAQYQTLPPVLPPLFLRIGRAYSLNGDLWESAVVYRELMRRWPRCAELEAALYGSIVVFDKLKQVDRAQSLCQAYLTQFPKGKYADSVAYLHGALAYDAQDFEKAVTYFEDSLHNEPTNPRREQIELIIGDINLRQQKFDDAIASYGQYQKDFPQGAFLEQAEYRSALALLFGGKTENADQALHAYLQKHPQGAYVADGEYRLAVIKFAAKQYDQVIADCLMWQQKHGKLGPLAEVLSLMGDCYASEDKNEEALNAYISSYKVAQTVDVLNYSIFAAAKILQKQAKWTDIVQMFQEFIAANPDHPTVVSAIFWMGRADIKLGKVEEAKQFMAATAKQYLDDPSRGAVDEIITQLAQLYAHTHPAGAAPAASGPPGSVKVSTPAPVSTPVLAAASPATEPSPAASSVTPSPTPPAAASDPAKDLADILMIPDIDSKPTARARILYAKAELARVQRKPEIEQQILLDIAKEFKPEDLSPILLGQVGDCLVQDGQPAQADPFYHFLMDEYDQSPEVDYAYNGLGQIAYSQKDYTKALKYFSKALDKGLAASKLKEITLGEGQTLLALNRLDEAKPYFEEVASTRAWRGEVTALSVFSLGEIQMGQGKYAEANAYFQRVFVAYQRYPAIQAKAYLNSGEAFEKLGKIPEAINTYSEMLKNPNLSEFPEISDAKQRLEHLAQK
jgi:TolA-binding protein